MKASGPSFEVYCDRCRVTFPVGTRRCIHCGGPTGASRARPLVRFEAGRKSEPGRQPEPVGEPEPAQAEVEPELGRRRFVSPVTLAWIVLIAAGYLYRACAGQAP